MYFISQPISNTNVYSQNEIHNFKSHLKFLVFSFYSGINKRHFLTIKLHLYFVFPLFQNVQQNSEAGGVT